MLQKLVFLLLTEGLEILIGRRMLKGLNRMTDGVTIADKEDMSGKDTFVCILSRGLSLTVASSATDLHLLLLMLLKYKKEGNEHKRIILLTSSYQTLIRLLKVLVLLNNRLLLLIRHW
ncbi:hypothetical protein RND81_06G123100 [Saponaria officinalis]|uniref:Uncharacterized protein n=1 Tax=Saponaria officinalis TaxID=3572 RepID=A0AAW1K994_SAPOF